MRLKTISISLALIANCFILQAQLTEKDHFEISKNLDIFNALFKELNMFYVDTLDVGDMMQTNINGMLRRLDPYTEYISEDKMSDFQFLTTGEYAGIGSIISTRGGKVIIVDPYEGMPAAQAGLQPGDELLEIDGVSLKDQTSAFASERLKGQPNTKIKIKYQRLGSKKPAEVEVTRKRIYVNPVTYYGIMKDTIGYIYLSDFTAQCSQEVKSAFDDLRKRGIKSLIFDVRDNGGGVVDDALEILNMFVPKGELLLSMKGKAKQMDRTYRATQLPIDEQIPMVVLVNNNSASASEIVAGTLQDLDRAVIIGTRTYGKGLVQSPRQLPYNGSLKVTTSKYYIPSGRCIQAIDYAHRNQDGSVAHIPDSLTSVFYTSKGRPVRDGGGINPDFIIEQPKIPNISYYMKIESIFFDFVNQWRLKHPQIALPSKFVLTDDDYNAFRDFVKSKDFKYDRQSEKALAALKEIMEFEGYLDAASDEFSALENKLKPDLDRDLELYKPQLSFFLGQEIMKQYYYAKGELIYSLRTDSDLDKALEILQNRDTYMQTLLPVPDKKN